jgi:hypothetical protein
MLNDNRILPALLLAVIMLVGCNQPVGLPNYDAHIASTCTTYICLAGGSNMTGWVSKSVDEQSPNGWYADTFGVIKRHCHLEGGYVHPKTYGFCVFSVHHFESPNAVPVCTLHYYQAEHYRSFNLVFNWVSKPSPSWPPDAESLWKGIDTSSFPLAPTQGAQSDGWCKLALTDAGAGIIEGIAEGGGGALVTGWKYTNPSSDWYTIVNGNTPDYLSPYIKVVYYPN